MNKQRLMQQRRAGYSLLEMTLSMAVLAIAMAAVGTAVNFAASAIPDSGGTSETLADDSRVLAQIGDDLSVARYVIEQSQHAVTVVVSDRTGDGNPDRIRYAWSGQQGDPLTYTMNEEDPINLLEAVAEFNLVYTVEAADHPVPIATRLGSEKTVDAYTAGSSTSGRTVEPTRWYGQVVTPALTADAIGFLPTRFKLYSKLVSPSDGSLLVELRNRTGATPGTGLYGNTTIAESTLSASAAWSEFGLNNADVVQRDEKLALYFKYQSGNNKVIEIVETSVSGGLLGLGGGNGGQIASSNAGVSWSLDDGKTFLYQLLGREVLVDTSQYDVIRQHHTTIEVSLMSDVPNRSPLSRRVGMLLAPPTLTGFCETHFDGNPTTMDLNADRQADWQHSAGAFPMSSLSSGLWVCDGQLIAQPTGLSSAEVITVRARIRSNSTLGPTIYGPYTIDNANQLLPVQTQLRSDGLGGQELVIYNDTTMTTPRSIITGLPAGLIDVTLTLLPGKNLLYVQVKDQSMGAIILDRVSNPGTIAVAVKFGTAGGVAEFGSASVHVGGTVKTNAVDSGGLVGDLLDLLLR